MKSRILSLFIVLLFVNSMIIPAFADNSISGTDATATTTASREQSTCSNSSLTAEEVQKIKDDLRVNGFQGQNFEAGEKNPNPELLATDRIMITEPTKGTGLDVNIAQEIMPTKQLAWLFSNKFSGPVTFGLILDDTLRLGRCSDEARKTNQCSLEGEQRSLRNSGYGIESDFEMAWDAVAPDIFEKGQKLGDISEEKKELIRTQLDYEKEKEQKLKDLKAGTADENDDSSFKLMTYKRLQTDEIANYIDSPNFTARMESNDKLGLSIDVYSMFDKYYNAIFSTELVLSNTLPMLINRARKLFYSSFQRLEVFWPKQMTWQHWAKKLEVPLYGLDNAVTGVKSGFWQKQGSKLLETRNKVFQGRLRKYNEIYDFHYTMCPGGGGDSGYKIIKGGGFEAFLNEQLKDDGGLGKIKDPNVREQMMNYWAEMKVHTRMFHNLFETSNSEKDAIIKAAKSQLGSGEISQATLDAVSSSAKKKHARNTAKIMQDADNWIQVDLPELFLRKDEFGMLGKGFYNENLKNVQSVYGDSTLGDMQLYQPFIKDGDWANSAFKSDAAGNLVMYELGPGKKVSDVTKDNLDQIIADALEHPKSAMLEDGTFMPVTKKAKAVIMDKAPNPIPIYDMSSKSYKEAGVLTPEDFTERLTDNYANKRMFRYMEHNASLGQRILEDQSYAGGRRYTSLLDKVFAQENELIKQYFQPRGALKFTALPFAFWWLKQGFGQAGFSAYMLPEDWTLVEFYLGEGPLYDNSFIDFFANEGSDTGDIMNRVFNLLPWKQWVLDPLSEKFEPLKFANDVVSGTTRKDMVGDTVFYLINPETCTQCSTVFVTDSAQNLVVPSFANSSPATGALFEKVLKGQISEQALISYGYKMNLKGRTTIEGTEPQDIDLAKAIANDKVSDDKQSCMAISKELGFGIDLGKKVGGVYALGENMVYYFFGWSGVLITMAEQIAWLSQLNECIDTEEGYFVHFYSNNSATHKGTTSELEKRTSDAADMLSKGKKNVEALINTSQDSLVGKGFQEAGAKIDDFSKTAATNALVQSTMILSGPYNGSLRGTALTYLKLEPNFEATKSSYDTQSRMKVVGMDLNGNKMDVLIDNKTDTITLNGKDIVTTQDHTRMSFVNGKGPFIEVPQRLSAYGLAGTDLLMEVSTDKHLKIIDAELLDCLKSAVEHQTGLTQTTNDLYQSFGYIETVSTDLNPQITIDDLRAPARFIVNGFANKTIIDDKGKLQIFADRKTTVLHSGEEEFDAGKIVSITFEHGTIVYKPETNEFLIHLKRHKSGVLDSSKVGGFKATLEKTKNDITDCPEEAIQFEVFGEEGSELSQKLADDFTKSLKKMGPFQVFDTPNYTYMFHSELDAESGECISKFRIIDKKTGEVYDQTIAGPIQKTPNGIQFKTADGRNHDLEFMEENGVPILNYNDRQETLASAGGKNGSFWYDPNTGKWYAENSQIIPLLEAFKQRGVEFKGDGQGNVTGVPSTNIFLGDQGTAGPNPLANLPSWPENPLVALLVLIAFAGSFSLIRKKKFD